VALFNVDESRHALVFCWPRTLATVGNIPLKAVNSVVAKSANERIAIVDNSFATTRHLYMLEHFLANKEERIKVQKLMSVPVISDNRVKAVIQVTRKGVSAAAAGADFSEADLKGLERIAAVVGAFDL
jgi:hypothetical protein